VNGPSPRHRHIQIHSTPTRWRELEEYRRLHEDVAGAHARYEASWDAEDFWRLTAESFCGLRRCGRALPRRLPPEEHPGIMRDVLTSNGGSYSSLDRERLIDEIIGMR
jgi:hypothetical protein